MTWLFHPYRRFFLLGAMLYAGMTWLGYRVAGEQGLSAEWFSVIESCSTGDKDQTFRETTADTVAIVHHFNRVKGVRPLPRRIDPLVAPDIKIPLVVRPIPPPPPPPPPPKPVISCGGWGPHEFKPIFPGCDEEAPYAERRACGKQKLIEFVYANIRYPANAREWSCSGTAVVEFVVGREGRVEAAEIITDPGCGLGKVAQAAVMKMNEFNLVWTPGFQNGRSVAVKLSLPVRFVLK